jgi:cell shape-determining protein MreC
VLADAGGAGALVGTVIEVTDRTARVRFVVDTRSVVIAVDQETRALGEVRGRAGQLVFTNVPVTERIGPDDSVVTAGITVGDDSSLYPPGLLLGRVQAVEPDPNPLTQTAYLVPAVDPADLERLLIVLDSEGG